MLAALTVFTLALFGQAAVAASTPNPLLGELTNAGAKFPVADVKDATVVEGKTLSTHGVLHTNTAQDFFPATLLLCPTDNCISCFPLDLSTFPVSTCLAELFTFQSVAINQPSDEGLPFGVFVGGGGCTEFTQIPVVNTCYNLFLDVPASDVSIN
ncbi:hypothetical protein C8Q70DRAFT_251629 [Cubamyces menziesii]|uniref:Uncharacterized protein n=1 Tax=Trametes cubensis TaxID=1111947 RepID=A0AAD7X8P3_9APHY|nr:hypothetical protein C8Q70DRAFT_251629 [Cubamyces menziesii]KAJ8472746.1 hypothetical protein ONZ51_g8300 [Trametes cubensis]